MTGKAFLPALLTVALLGLPAAAPAQDLYHHLHLRSGDAVASAQWYKDHMDCEEYGREGACMVDNIQIIFYTNDEEPTGPSVGSGVDHIGFSFTDLEAKMAGWKAAGVKVLEDIREVQGLFKLAFVEDPWGNKIEVVEDHQWLGFHHIHLRSADPETTLTWYESLFGGVPDKLKGRIAGLRYDGLWLLVGRAEGELQPTQGRALDHLGWSFDDLDAAIADMQGKGVELESGPREIVNRAGQQLKIAFIVSAEGIRIELVEVVG
jgi:catechol 2,3-dioxygenase-like lactoylglutathione lyase family enzyme